MNRRSLASSTAMLLAGTSALLAAGCVDPGATNSLTAALHGGAITVTVAASGGNPVDTAPSANGSTFYFIGSDGRGPGVFRVSAGGNGNPVHGVRSGAPFVSPQSIAASGNRLYVADPGANSIFAIGAHSGRIEGTLGAGDQPRGVDLANDDLYYTGVEARSGKSALFHVDARGRSEAVFTGAPLSSPGAVAVSHDGVAYVTDAPGVPGAGRVIAIDLAQRSATVLAQGLNLGDPAGAALTLDDRSLLVSGIDGQGHSQVYLVDTATGAIASYAGGGIGANTASGGVHRAANRDIFGWAGRTGGGTVYYIELSARAYNGQ